MYSIVQPCTILYNLVKPCKTLYKLVKPCTTLYIIFVQPCHAQPIKTPVPILVQQYTTMYSSVQPHIALYNAVQPCTTVYKHVRQPVQPCTTMCLRQIFPILKLMHILYYTTHIINCTNENNLYNVVYTCTWYMVVN